MPALRAELHPDLRAQAERAATSRSKPPDELVEAARRGRLSRSNTESGTEGRQAVDAVLYAKRAAKAAPGESVRSRLGHERPGAEGRTMSVLLDGPARYVELSGLSRGEARRLARYDSLLGQLGSGKLRAAEFERRVSGWRPIRGLRFLANADAALVLVEERRAEDVDVFHYDPGRP